MDFGSLLHAAHANEVRAKKEPSKCYRTSFSPPKKENKNKSLSVNIQKFLARKEEEEKLKVLEAKKKKEELLALRSQDNKAKKRVGAMLKRTKSANKSAIEDAVDDDNTAVTINGPSQPDEDDYGYVSQEASAYYNKLMDKYNSTPAEEPLYSQSKKVVHRDLNRTKDRVRMALLKEEEEEMMPHKRRRRSKSKREEDPGDATLDYSHSDMRDFEGEDDAEMPPPPPPKPKVKKMAPPPMDFRDLLKLAEKKQFEPIKIEPKKKPEEEDARPMTKKQKAEYMKELEWRRRKEEAAKAGREAPSQNNMKGNGRGDNGEERSGGAVDRQQERKSVQQMRIPKLNSAKVEERQVLRKEEPNNNRREEKLVAQKQSSSSLKQNASGPSRVEGPHHSKLGDKTSKVSSGSETVAKMPRVSSGSNLNAKPSRGDNGVVQNNIQRSDSVSSSTSAAKNSFSRGSEGRQTGESGGTGIKKSSLQSGYDRKIQEAIMAKMEEVKRSSDIKRSSSNEIVSSKLLSRPMEVKDKAAPKREIERNEPAKMADKVTKVSHSADMPIKSFNAKQQESGRSVSQNKPKTVGLSKLREVPVDSKPKVVPSNSKQIVPFERTRPPTQTDARDRTMLSTDNRTNQLLPPNRDRAVSGAMKVKQIPPSGRAEKIAPSDSKPRQSALDVKSRQFPPADVRTQKVPASDARPRQFPLPDVQTRQLPPNIQRKQFPPGDVRKRPNPSVKRRVIDSDEEYDSEMDDFIDDGPQDDEDVSRHIREIFGYDKRKYQRIQEEDDDECMESNYASILKEEFISTKTGIMEDLEDIRREKEMERRKKAFKKGKV